MHSAHMAACTLLIELLYPRARALDDMKPESSASAFPAAITEDGHVW